MTPTAKAVEGRGCSNGAQVVVVVVHCRISIGAWLLALELVGTSCQLLNESTLWGFASIWNMRESSDKL